MRRCPKCNQEFADEWLTFCTQDGTSLIDVPVSTTEPPPTCDPSVDTRGFGSVPTELVGAWNGGAGDETGYWWTIYSDGRYTMANDRLGTWEEGWMDVQADVLTFYPDCGETTSTDWSMDSYDEFTILYLRDRAYSFVPA